MSHLPTPAAGPVRLARGCLAACAVGLVCLVGAPPASAETYTFRAVADAYTDSASASRNFGLSSAMRADADSLKVAYMRFSPAFSSGVSKATLRVYTAKASSIGLEARSVATTPWEETKITHAARPAVSSTVLGRSGAYSSGQWVSLDVTAAVTASQAVTLALTTTSKDEAIFSSREAGSARAPQLVVETGGTQPPPTSSEPPPTSSEPPPTSSDPKFTRRPYSDRSPWNTPIGANPTVHPNSAAGVSLIGGPLTSDPTQYTYPLYFVDSSTPRVPVTLSGMYSNVTGTATEDTKLTRTTRTTVEVPVRPEFSPANGSDSQIIIVDPVTGDEWGFWQLKKDASGKWTASNGYHYNVFWDGHPPRDSSNRPFGSRGAGVTYFSGLIRPWEIRSGRIQHALAFAFGGNSWPSVNWVFPAAKSDGSSNDPNSLPEGARLQLDPSLTESDLRARGCNAAAVIIARAMQEYGMYVIDQSGSDKIMMEYDGTAGDWSSLGVNRNTPNCIPLNRLRRVG